MRLDVFHGFAQLFHEAIEVFFIQKNFMPLIIITVKTFGAFCHDEVKIIASRPMYIKKISPSLARPHF